MELNGRVGVVTGGASGIGFAMAQAFAAKGMKVVLGDVEAEALSKAVAALEGDGAEALGVETDVRDPKSVEDLRDATLSKFGAAHVLCNNAGVAVGGPLWQVPLESWQWVFGVNFWGVVHGIRSFVPLLMEQGEGHVVNTASAAGIVAPPFLGPYAATKFAVVAISETLHGELAGSGVGVSVVCPLWVKTRIHESDRNAPPEVAGSYAGTPMEEGAREAVAGFINSGIDPAVVGDKVVAAITEGHFYVFPHEEMYEVAKQRGEAISRGELPGYTALL